MMIQPQFDAVWAGARNLRLPERDLLDSTDVDEAQHVMGSVLADNCIKLDESPSEFRLLVRECSVGDLWLAHVTSGSGMTIRSKPLDCYAFDLTLRGLNSVQHGADAVSANRQEATMFSPFSATSLSWSRQTEVLCLKVPKLALEQQLQRLSGVSAPMRFDARVDRLAAPWLRSVIGQALVLFAGATDNSSNAIAWQLRDSMLTAMLLELSHDQRELILDQNRAAESRLCDAAIALMGGLLAKPPSISAIARRLFVSERTLQVSFREYLGTTPSAAFKQLRLEAVRRALLRSDSGHDTVTRVAVEVGGFAHHGRFAHEYYSTFGEYPSETMSRGCDDTGSQVPSAVTSAFGNAVDGSYS